MSLGLSVRPFALNNSAPTVRIFMKYDTWGFFENSVSKIQVSLKCSKNNGYFTWRLMNNYYNISLNSSNEKYFSQVLKGNIKRKFYVQIFFSRKSCRVWDNKEICGSRPGHRWQQKTAHARCMLGILSLQSRWLHERAWMTFIGTLSDLFTS
jgi:hypothetical protein